MQITNLSLFGTLSSQLSSSFTIFPCRLSCKCGHILSLHWLLTSGMLAPSRLKNTLWITDLLYYSMFNRPDLCNIFYLAIVLSLNSLFWMNTDFVTWSLLYNEMQTMKRLNQFTKNLFVKQRGNVPNLVWAVHAALDKGVKNVAVRQMKIKASAPQIYFPFKSLCCNL